MPGHRNELAQAFLQKARNDLFTARSTLTAPDGPTDTPCFHAQQAAEKALKALLTTLGCVAPRTHDLLVLLDTLPEMPPELEPYREALGALAAYAVEVRYPDDWYEPPREEALNALEIAQAFVTLIAGMVEQTREKPE